jgi:hypothetical protein
MRWERTGKRDLTYSLWHRTLGDDISMIDIDSVEYCNRCLEPLALIETAIDTGQHKYAYITRRLAEKLGVPAFIVLYRLRGKKIVSFRVIMIYPEYWVQEFTPDQFGYYLTQLHTRHKCILEKQVEKNNAKSLTNLSNLF